MLGIWACKSRTVAKKWYRGRQRFSADRRVVIDVLTARRTNVKSDVLMP
ncbi:hypothetical protein ACOMHN_047349 [Nucella lapillus]